MRSQQVGQAAQLRVGQNDFRVPEISRHNAGAPVSGEQVGLLLVALLTTSRLAVTDTHHTSA
jgi:hypothetical protein